MAIVCSTTQTMEHFMNQPTEERGFLVPEIDALKDAMQNLQEGKSIPLGRSIDVAEIAQHTSSILEALDQDLNDEVLRRTPNRYAQFLAEFLSPEPIEVTTFPAPQNSVMVLEKNISFFSLCEHHLLPFFGTVAIAYVPDKKVVGISKLARLVDLCSRRLQMQERLTNDIGHLLQSQISPRGIAVHIKARHCCQEMRGIKAVGAETETSLFSGEFEKLHLRYEFLQRINT